MRSTGNKCKFLNYITNIYRRNNYSSKKKNNHLLSYTYIILTKLISLFFTIASLEKLFTQP